MKELKDTKGVDSNNTFDNPEVNNNFPTPLQRSADEKIIIRDGRRYIRRKKVAV